MSQTAQYRFRVTHSDDVEVTSEGDMIALQLHSVPGRPHSLWRSSAECIATDHRGLSLSVQRTRRFPKPCFVIAKESKLRATVQCTHPLRLRYQITLVGGATWMFHMPLFCARFSGSSSHDGSLQVRMLRENLWDLLVDVDHNSSELLAAVACIQRARWQSM
jgi:hypothetical protein